MKRKAYPSDVNDEEWAFSAPYLSLMREAAPQREYDLRDVFNGLRWMVRSGAAWRMMPHDLPPWWAVYQRLAAGRHAQPSATIFDGRTLQSTPESGGRAGYDGHKKKRGSKVHLAVDTLGHLLALPVTPANAQERAQVDELARQVQEVTSDHVEVAFVDQGYTGEEPAQDAAAHDMQLVVVKLPEAKKGFVLLPKRWVVERSFAWTTRFRRLARDFERLPATLAALHFLAFAILMLKRLLESVTLRS